MGGCELQRPLEGLLSPVKGGLVGVSGQPGSSLHPGDLFARGVIPDPIGLGGVVTSLGPDGFGDAHRGDNNLSRLYLRDRGRFNAAMRTGLGEQILLANGTKMSVEAALEECPLVFLRIPRRGRSGAKKMNG